MSGGGAAGSMASAGRAAAGGSVGSAGAPNTGGTAAGGVGASSSGGAQAGKAGSADDGGASGAGRGGTSGTDGGASAGAHSAGATAAGSSGSAGAHDCKITVDLNGYTQSKPGCGGYTACKGQIHFRNNEAQPLTQMTLSFSVASGVRCTSDNATSKWAITDTGAASQRCVFTASPNALTVEASSSLGFGFDTNQTDEALPTSIVVSDPSCG